MICLSIVILTVLLIILSVIFFPTISIKNIKLSTFWIISLISAIILIMINQVSINNIKNIFLSDSAVNPIKILVLFISMTILSIFLDEIGFFKYIAIKAAKLFKKSQIKLFIGFYILISILTIFTSNDIIILTFTPFICYYTKNAKINALPYLISEFVAANTWSMILIIGNPTNIYLASALNINFIEYLKTMILPTIFAAVTSFIILFLIFHRQLNKPIEEFNEQPQPINKFLLIIGLVHLLCATFLLAISSYINLEMYLITLVFSLSLLSISTVYLVTTKQKLIPIKMTLIRAPWNLVPFVLSMFILVLSMQEQGITSQIIELLSKSEPTYTYAISAAFCANLINNIPMSVLYSTLLQSASLKAVYATIMASNISAFITPIGALAGIMFMSLLKVYGIKLNFFKFMQFGLIIGIPTLLVGVSALFIVL